MYYKLTKFNMTTRNGFKWELNKKFEIIEEKQLSHRPLCTDSWFHVYNSPLLAILLNPIHADISNPRLFECECGGYCKLNKGLKLGWTKVKLINEIEVPQISITQKVAFGILCAKELGQYTSSWNVWADNWLNNIDRSAEAARTVVGAVARAAAGAVARASAEAARFFAAAAAEDARFFDRTVVGAVARTVVGAVARASAGASARAVAAAAAAAAAEAADVASAEAVPFNLVELSIKALTIS